MNNHSKEESHSYFKDLLFSILKSKCILVSLTLILTIFFTGMILELSPYFKHLSNIDLSKAYIKPCKSHVFGTNEFGQDMFYMILTGCFNTLCFSFIIFFVNFIIGLVIGTIWGCISKLDFLVIFLKGVIDNIPMLFVYIVFIIRFGKTYYSLFLILILFEWIDVACLVRNNLILLKSKEYNIYSKINKVSLFKQALYNYLPALIPIVFNYFAISIPYVISIEVSFSYLSFPINYTSASLGNIIYSTIYSNNSMMYPHLLIFPLLFLIIINLCVFLLGKTISKKAMLGGSNDVRN